ncbi:helix-turn-helix transcriptional regulator [Variovorax boronicumulans]|uniref:helix-turn-helix transcriptional regulator n=1 Tax=Variovorax boronicumulans TaxID=436515 RepID=UPI0036F2D093
MRNTTASLQGSRRPYGVSRSSLHERQNPKSRYHDKTFPSPVQIEQRAIGYREDKLDAWIASQLQKEQ